MSDGTEKAMRDLEIGDKVLVEGGKFEPIYSFAHRQAESKSEFLHLATSTTTLAVTKYHLVFANGHAVPSFMVKVGDMLTDASGEAAKVESIKTVTGSGIYAPLTPSGKIVVNNIMASCFVSLNQKDGVQIAGVHFSFHFLSHAFEFPHRLVCHYFGSCFQETYDEASGIATWAVAPMKFATWMIVDNERVLLVAFLTAAFVFRGFELVVLLKPIVVVLAFFLAAFISVKKTSK